jgi:hypothetical protein
MTLEDSLGMLVFGICFWIVGWFMAWIAGAFKCNKEREQR